MARSPACSRARSVPDIKWISKGNTGGGESRNLDYFDAIVAVNTTGNWGLSDEQKKEFLSFIRDDGRGFVGVHAALDAHRNGLWPEYTEMIGGEFAAHPWNHFPAPVIIEDHDFPATRHFSSKRLVLFDEMYMPKMETFSRSKVNVLMRLDENKLGAPLNAGVVGGPEPPPPPPGAAAASSCDRTATSRLPGPRPTARDACSIPASATPRNRGPIPTSRRCISRRSNGCLA